MSGADEFRGAPEFGVCASRRHRGHRLTAPHQRTGVGFHARTRFDRHRFAGEHGLIEQDFSRGEVHVGSNHATERKFHHIARDQFGGSMLPLASEAHVYSKLSFSSLIVSALIIVPQVIVAVMAPWMGRQAKAWGRRPLLLAGFAALPCRAPLFAWTTNRNDSSSPSR
jgi:hypothetical protein